MERLDLVASLVSLLVSIISMALSVYFYVESKNAEREAAKCLESIRIQANTLQRMTNSHLGRLLEALVPRSKERNKD